MFHWVKNKIKLSINSLVVDRVVNSLESKLEFSLEQNQRVTNQKIAISTMETKWFLIDQWEKKNPPLVDFCPICEAKIDISGLKKFESYCKFGGGILMRYQCNHCQVLFGPIKMLNLTPEELSKEYEIHYSVFSEGDSSEAEIRAFNLLRPVKTGKYLNFGSGAWSKSTEHLRTLGYNVYNFEPTMSASEQNDYTFNSYSALEGIHFDGIFSNNVLEHLRFPKDTFTKLSKILASKGRMVSATPCYDYLYEYTRFHLFFYLEDSYKKLFDERMFQEIEMIRDGEFIALVLEKR